MEQLYKLLKPSQDTNTSSLAQRGNFFSALNSCNNDLEPRVIDSGATNHMIGCKKLFSSCNPSSRSFKVKIAYGSFSTVAETGTIKISPNIELHYALHSPNLSCNLLSISNSTRDLKCGTHFLKSFVCFRTRFQGRR